MNRRGFFGGLAAIASANCINCGAPPSADGQCEHCGTTAVGVRSCGECPMNRYNFKVVQGPTYQRWYDKKGNLVREFRVWDDGMEQGMEEVYV